MQSIMAVWAGAQSILDYAILRPWHIYRRILIWWNCSGWRPWSLHPSCYWPGSLWPSDGLELYLPTHRLILSLAIHRRAVLVCSLILVHVVSCCYWWERTAALRASLGHPEPYPLKWVEIGNEDFVQPSTYADYRWPEFVGNLSKNFPNLRKLASNWR